MKLRWEPDSGWHVVQVMEQSNVLDYNCYNS